MEFCPSEHEPELPPPELAVDHLDLVDPDLCFALGMPSMEVGVSVSSWYIQIVIPKKRLIVGITLMLAKRPVAPSFPGPRTDPFHR